MELTPFLLVLTGAVLVWGLPFPPARPGLIARSQIFQLMQDAVVVLDPFGRVVDANLAAEPLLGQPVGQVVGQPLAQLVPGWATASPRAWRLYFERHLPGGGDHRRSRV